LIDMGYADFIPPVERPTRLNLPADYVQTLRTLADRYGETYGIFAAGNNLLLETVKPGRKRTYLVTYKPRKGSVPQAPDPADHWCSAQVKRRGRNVFGLCENPAHTQHGEDWLCLLHSTQLGALNK
jgi:hypothetical protein